MFTINKHPKGYINGRFDETEIPSGVTMAFQNGNTISIQFASGNYCENRNESKPTSKNAEIAIWNEKNKWYNFGDENVKGWCDTDEVAKWINFAANTTF